MLLTFFVFFSTCSYHILRTLSLTNSNKFPFPPMYDAIPKQKTHHGIFFTKDFSIFDILNLKGKPTRIFTLPCCLKIGAQVSHSSNLLQIHRYIRTVWKLAVTFSAKWKRIKEKVPHSWFINALHKWWFSSIADPAVQNKSFFPPKRFLYLIVLPKCCLFSISHPKYPSLIRRCCRLSNESTSII